MGIKPEGNCLRFSNHGSVDFLGKTLLVVLPKTRRVFLKKKDGSGWILVSFPSDTLWMRFCGAEKTQLGLDHASPKRMCGVLLLPVSEKKNRANSPSQSLSGPIPNPHPQPLSPTPGTLTPHVAAAHQRRRRWHPLQLLLALHRSVQDRTLAATGGGEPW